MTDPVDRTSLVFKLLPKFASLDWSSLESPSELSDDGLRAVAEYVERNRGAGARLIRLHSDNQKTRTRPPAWEFALPSDRAGFPLSGINYLRLVSPGDDAPLRSALAPSVEYVEYPAIFQRDTVSPTSPGPDNDEKWAVKACGFVDVWKTLDNGGAFGELAIIDNGSDGLRHPELQDRFTYIPPAGVNGSAGSHVASVAAVIGARRNDPDFYVDYPGMDGCCSAMLRIYNVWSESATQLNFDFVAFHSALAEIATKHLPVLNLSLSSPAIDSATAAAIEACLDNNVVVVAAMGDYGKTGPARYPASLPRVIAVGSTGTSGVPRSQSPCGPQLCLSAPGEAIWTVNGNNSFAWLGGSSFSTAMVSAAVWLARKRAPKMLVPETRAVIELSVADDSKPNTPSHRDDCIGFGRLDVVAMERELDRRFPRSAARASTRS